MKTKKDTEIISPGPKKDSRSTRRHELRSTNYASDVQKKSSKVRKWVPQSVQVMKASAGETTTVEQTVNFNQLMNAPSIISAPPQALVSQASIKEDGSRLGLTLRTMMTGSSTDNIQAKRAGKRPITRGGGRRAIELLQRDRVDKYKEKVAARSENFLHYGDLVTIRCESQQVHLVSYNRLYDSINCENYGTYTHIYLYIMYIYIM